MAKAERRKRQLAEEEARRPRGEDGKPGGSRGQAGTVASLGTQRGLLSFLSQALQGLSWGSLGGLWIAGLLPEACGSALQSGRGPGSKKRCVSSTPCWPTSGRASSCGRQPGAGETLKQAAVRPQQILQRPRSPVRPEPLTFSPLPSGTPTHTAPETLGGVGWDGDDTIGTTLKMAYERTVPPLKHCHLWVARGCGGWWSTAGHR